MCICMYTCMYVYMDIPLNKLLGHSIHNKRNQRSTHLTLFLCNSLNFIKQGSVNQ